MKILIADKFEQAGIDQLTQLGCDVVYRPGTSGPTLTTALSQEGFDVLIVRSCKVLRETIKAARGLKLIVRAGAGTDTIDVGGAMRCGIRVCNCPGMNSTAVAELTIGMMIALDRRIVEETDDLRHRVWNKKEYSKSRGLMGRTLGILGMGRIGYEVAKRARAFDMRILYADVIERPEIERELSVHRVSRDELFAESDFLTLHVPGGEETIHLINEETLARMKPTAFLINCSRGGVVDETALGAAINAGRIAGAALDVYEIEPSADDREFKDPILDVRRVYGTHHIGASTEQAQSAVAQETVRIVRGFLEKGEFINCTNEPTGEMIDAA